MNTVLPPVFGDSFVSLPGMIARHARVRPGDAAWVTGGERLSWSAFDAAVSRAAQALVALGLGPGERLALLAGGSLWSWTQVFAALRCGAVVAPLAPLLTSTDLARLLRDSGTRLLLVGEGYEAQAEAVAAQFGPSIRLVRETAPPLAAGDAGAFPHLRREDPCNLIYSSGTTGLPKGILHAHGARSQMAQMLAVEFGINAGSRTLLTTPPHTNGSWMVVLPTLFAGGTMIQSSGYTPARFLEEVREYRPTHGFIVPAQARAILDQPEAKTTDFSSFTALITAGSPMPVELKRQWCQLTGQRLMELWGLTEGVATVMPPREMPHRLHSVGRPLAGCELRIIGADGQELPAGEIGEIVGRSPALMEGYWNRPDANREVLWHDAAGNPYLRTGDLGALDADGFLTLRGRSKDMILSGGLNVYPVDIEQPLLAHPAVRDATVIGVPDPRWGEVPVAFVQLRSTASVGAGELQAWLNPRVAKHQRLHDLLVVAEDFPRNTLGKVLKNTLREHYRASPLREQGP